MTFKQLTMPFAHFVVICCWLAAVAGCENTDLLTATDAGMDAVKAVALSEREVQEIAVVAARRADGAHTVASPDSPYGKRLNRLVAEQLLQGGAQPFTYAVYLSPEVNAFAMANGTIRIYSGLMDLLDDGELRFVIGHEMGHVVKQHIRQQLRLAYAASAVRKGIASQQGAAGEIARSLVGGLAETMMNAQFSQLEEKEADDYGLAFLKRSGFSPEDAVSALRKLAALAPGHSFLSSHPEPGQRADRLQAQLEGRARSIEENKEDFIARAKAVIEGWATVLRRYLGG